MNFAVFASGQGGNLQAIIDALRAKKIKACLSVVFSDKEDSFALERARKAKIPAIFLSPKKFSTRAEFDMAVIKAIAPYKVDFIVLAGYMRLLSKEFIQSYEHKILNIHPSLLPAFKGTHAIRDAYEQKVKVTGISVHFVVEAMDAGKIIAQKAVVISPKDTYETLAKKMHQAEHSLYPKVIDRFARGIIA